MRFLADAGISPATVAFLQSLGHDALHVREVSMQRASDHEVLDRARIDDRIVLTFDLDFGEFLALGLRDRPSAIIFRLEDETAQSVNHRLGIVLAGQAATRQAGALVLVEDARYRIRRLLLG